MHIQKLSLIGFKNYVELTLDFSEKINCLVGPNGSGKTNVLDAIHYLSMTKSAFNTADNQNIKFEDKLFSIKGIFIDEQHKYEILCGYQQGSKKVFRVNKKDYHKLSEHIGRFPVVLIEPNDTDLIRGAAELRRKFFDTIICQLDYEYLQKLIQYTNNLKQRNALLKRFSLANKVDEDLIEPYTVRAIKLGKAINRTRRKFVDQFSKIQSKKYQEVANLLEKSIIEYNSDFNSDKIEYDFRNSLKRELILGRTLMGIHKDDYIFYLNGEVAKKFGSQGQQKSYVIALKLAQYEIVKNDKNISPILLLDDIFDKLDVKRVNNLIRIITENDFDQVFITDTHEDRIPEMLTLMREKPKVFRVQQSKIITTHD